MAGVIQRDHLINDPLDRIEELEERVAALERALTGKFATATQELEIVDAGTSGATEQAWVEVQVGGVVGYLRAFSSE